MSLKVIKRPGTATLYVSGSVAGSRVRESTGTSDPRRAEIYRAKREAELWDRSVHGARAVVTFAAAARSYLETDARSRTTGILVGRLILHFGTTPLGKIDQDAVDAAYRAILTPKAGNATKLRGVLTPLKAILEHAAIRKWCDRPAFETPSQKKAVTGFLRPAEATALVQAAAEHLRPLLVFLIGTGVRMSEALELEWDKVDLRGARAVVWQKQGNERQVDLPPVVVASLAALPHREGRLFRPPPRLVRNRFIWPEAYHDTGRTGGGQIKAAWAGACRRAGLPGDWRIWTPKGQKRPKKQWVPAITPHDLRHTWASWHYAVHRDLLRLKVEGGWGTVTMTERYAHLMPAAYADEARAWWAGGAKLTQAAVAG